MSNDLVHELGCCEYHLHKAPACCSQTCWCHAATKVLEDFHASFVMVSPERIVWSERELVLAKAIVELREGLARWQQEAINAARDRNPKGKTLLDFYATWLEQEKDARAKLEAQLATATARAEKAEADTKRLDQLEAVGDGCDIRRSASQAILYVIHGFSRGVAGCGATLRDAIDAAEIVPALVAPADDA